MAKQNRKTNAVKQFIPFGDSSDPGTEDGERSITINNRKEPYEPIH